MSEWISMGEECPAFRRRVLVFAPGEIPSRRDISVAVLRSDDFFHCDIEKIPRGNVTHWMPLPPPPKNDDA